LTKFNKVWTELVIMGDSSYRAVVLSILLLLSSQIDLSSLDNLKENMELSSNQEDVTLTEVRIHNLGEDWNASQVLEWSPNHLDYNRTMQFSILIEGVTSADSIESMTLNMTWIYNVSTGDPLLSENLSVSSLESHAKGLFMYFNYTYPLDIYHDEYVITLDTVESDQTLHRFNHEGINVISHDMFMRFDSIESDNKLLFANDQITDLELFIQNTGSTYIEIEFQVNILTQLPSNWEIPEISINDAILRGGENSYVFIEFEAPSDAYPPLDPLPDIVIQLIAEFEDFSGQMVECFNANYSLDTEVLPIYSDIYISAFRTDYGTDLIMNNYQQPNPSENYLNYSLFTLNNNNIEFYFELQNYGFSQVMFELYLSSPDSTEIEVYSSENDEKSITFGGEDAYFRNIEPLEIISFRVNIDFVSQGFEDGGAFSINVNNSNSGSAFELNIPIYSGLIEEIYYPTLQLESVENPQGISVLQKDNFDFYLLMLWIPILDFPNFENYWNIDVSVTDLNSNIVSGIEFTLWENNSSQQIPFQFIISQNQFFKLTFDISEEIIPGDYSINIDLEQMTSELNLKLVFEDQYNFSVLENTSLNEPIENNSNNNSTVEPNNNSDNSSIDETITNSSNSTSNNNQTIIDNSTDNVTDIPQGNNNEITQNENVEPDDSTSSKNSDTGTWLLVSVIFIVIALISVIIIRRRISPVKKSIDDEHKKNIVEINPIIQPMPQLQVTQSEELTVLRQWTDSNGYTWRQMSDRSMLWWNGQVWVPVNSN